MSAAQIRAQWSVAGYGIGNALTLIAGAMVAMQITEWRSERPLVWLLIAMVATLVADLLWVNSELRGDYEVGTLIDFAYFFYYLCLIMAARAQRRQRRRGIDNLGLQGDLRGSLPHHRAGHRQHRAARRPARPLQPAVTAADRGDHAGGAVVHFQPGARDPRSG